MNDDEASMSCHELQQELSRAVSTFSLNQQDLEKQVIPTTYFINTDKPLPEIIQDSSETLVNPLQSLVHQQKVDFLKHNQEFKQRQMYVEDAILSRMKQEAERVKKIKEQELLANEERKREIEERKERMQQQAIQEDSRTSSRSPTFHRCADPKKLESAKQAILEVEEAVKVNQLIRKHSQFNAESFRRELQELIEQEEKLSRQANGTEHFNPELFTKRNPFAHFRLSMRFSYRRREPVFVAGPRVRKPWWKRWFPLLC